MGKLPGVGAQRESVSKEAIAEVAVEEGSGAEKGEVEIENTKIGGVDIREAAIGE